MTDPALRRLAESLGVDVDALPSAAEQLGEERASLLAELVDGAVRQLGRDMERAVEDGLGLVPRPLRRPVMKVLGL